MIHKLVIFGGTSEGRELAEWSADQGFATVISVATGYGRQVLTARPNLSIWEGRLDRTHMREFLLREKPDLIIDATHPHAVEVTQTIRQAAKDCELPWVRVIREESIGFVQEYGKKIDIPGNSLEDQMTAGTDFLRVSSVQEAAKMLSRETGAVFLTTGSKELGEFVRYPELRERIYARVLPDSRVLASCEQMEIRGKHLIAMQGPFSVEMNMAMLRATNAEWMVTKESGANGGFYEKLKAARQCNVRVIMIDRPEHEKGLTVAQMKNRLLDEKPADGQAQRQRNIQKMCQVSLIGMGMGGGGQLTLEALKALTTSELIFGASRMLEDIRPYADGRIMVPFYMGRDIFDYLDRHPEFHTACVVYSGDTGYHSGCADFMSEMRTRGDRYSVRVFPGISTFSCLCARFRIRGETVFVASVHGREEDVISLLKNYGRVFLLLDRTHTISGICRLLSENGYGRTRIRAGVRLGYPDEVLFDSLADHLTGQISNPLAAMILEREDWTDAG